jgi:hypothetical protein
MIQFGAGQRGERMGTIPELRIQKTKATDTILKYVQDVNAGTIEHDRSKFMALLTEYGNAAGSLAKEEMVEQQSQQNWQSNDTDEDA